MRLIEIRRYDMKTSLLASLLLCSVAILSPGESTAATCDQYMGDNSIFAGATSSLKPNILIIIDTSGSMDWTVKGTADPYDPTKTYTILQECKASSNANNKSNCSVNGIYKKSSNNWVYDGYDLTSVTAITNCTGNPQQLLTSNGQYIGRSLTSSGTACSTRSNNQDTYATGKWVNWSKIPVIDQKKIIIARAVVKNLIQTTPGVNFGVMVYNGSQGSRFYTDSTSKYTSTIKDMDVKPTGSSKTNGELLAESINTSNIIASGNTPLGECLYEAGMYFGGKASAFGNTTASVGIDVNTGKYTTPITASCQKNYIIFVTDGAPTADDDPVLKTICPPDGDCDGDRAETSSSLQHSMDDVAKWLRNTDLLENDNAAGKEYTLGKQTVSTYTIGFNLPTTDPARILLTRAADSAHGKGRAYFSDDQAGLADVFNQIVLSILSIDTSFVAPVVPISPDNKTYGSNRVYMGFFKPQSQAPWFGNLKKYGLDANYNIVDMKGNPAFTSTSYSYWSDPDGDPDASSVDAGGAGAKLLTQTRNIYTYTGGTGTKLNLTDSSGANLFSTSNTAITKEMMNVADDTTKNDLINYVIGKDVYGMGSTTSVKREWMFGDVLHSKPVVVNYAKFAQADENSNKNKSIIYVGSNDGMLHAINDWDGSEAWAFIPPDVLPNLQDIAGETHTYGVDATPSVYIYDANKDGNIDTGDKVILLVGLRRGGGPNTYAGSLGSYYALDVSIPAAPKYLWSLSNTTTGFSELAESWGEPKFVKMKIGNPAISKIVAFLPGGYDNMNEDGRYGATQLFTGTGVDNTDSGEGSVTSAPTGDSHLPIGRGIYAVEIATLDINGKPDIKTTPTRIWGAVNGASTSFTASPSTYSDMKFSFVSDITTLDVDGNGYIDRLYATDLGGNLWRFDVGLTDVTLWKGYKIFSAKPDSASMVTGRKMFFKPIATLEKTLTVPSRGNDATLFIGSGDREHPSNTSVVDRIYAVRDKGQTTVTKYESDLIDVTTDALQLSTTTTAAVTTLLNSLSSSYGWYITLENSGEKVLAQPALTNKTVYFTTYAPSNSTETNPDPCKPSNMGTSRLYALDYATGEAVVDYYATNNTDTSVTNKRAKSGTAVLQKLDRSTELGTGIASGVVIVGDKALVGASGGITAQKTKAVPTGSSGGRIINLYWGQK